MDTICLAMAVVVFALSRDRDRVIDNVEWLIAGGTALVMRSCQWMAAMVRGYTEDWVDES